MKDFDIRNNIALTIKVCIVSVEATGELQRKNVSHVPQHLAGMEKCMDNSCEQTAKCYHRSLVIVNTECGQW